MAFQKARPPLTCSSVLLGILDRRSHSIRICGWGSLTSQFCEVLIYLFETVTKPVSSTTLQRVWEEKRAESLPSQLLPHLWDSRALSCVSEQSLSDRNPWDPESWIVWQWQLLEQRSGCQAESSRAYRKLKGEKPCSCKLWHVVAPATRCDKQDPHSLITNPRD